LRNPELKRQRLSAKRAKKRRRLSSGDAPAGIIIGIGNAAAVNQDRRPEVNDDESFQDQRELIPQSAGNSPALLDINASRLSVDSSRGPPLSSASEQVDPRLLQLGFDISDRKLLEKLFNQNIDTIKYLIDKLPDQVVKRRGIIRGYVCFDNTCRLNY
jgi:hypothetical protein